MASKDCKSSFRGSSILFLSLLLCVCNSSADQISLQIPSDSAGGSFCLDEFKGEPLLLHITNIESPICRECEETLSVQTAEIAKLHQSHSDINVVTINLRKNPYSPNGTFLAASWWGINVTWPWTDEYKPYPMAGKYIDYWTRGSGFPNPTFILIDRSGAIVGVHHVYQLGEGLIDGIQRAEMLYNEMKSIDRGEASGFKGIESRQSINYIGMFLLGIVTSLSPCSVALLLAMFSYVMTARRKEEYLRKSASASKEGFMIGVAFTLGMATVFFAIGLFLSDIGVFVRQARFFDLAAGLLMIVLGINIIKPIGEIIEPVTSLVSFQRGGSQSDYQPPDKKGIMERLVHISMDLFQYSAFIGAFTLGVFFALGWAPCAVSLVFPVLIWLISQNVTPLGGGLMLFVFGVGHGVPVIPIATFSRAVGGQIGAKYISAGKWVTKAFGLTVIVIGLVYAVRYIGFGLW